MRNDCRLLLVPTTALSTLASVSEPTTAVYSVNSSSAGSCLRISPWSIPVCRKSIARVRSGSSTPAKRSNASGPNRPPPARTSGTPATRPPDRTPHGSPPRRGPSSSPHPPAPARSRRRAALPPTTGTPRGARPCWGSSTGASACARPPRSRCSRCWRPGTRRGRTGGSPPRRSPPSAARHRYGASVVYFQVRSGARRGTGREPSHVRRQRGPWRTAIAGVSPCSARRSASHHVVRSSSSRTATACVIRCEKD